MPFEALAWTLIILLGPVLARLLKPRLGRIDRGWFELAGWVHAVWLPFLSVILGSLSARSAGIFPFDLLSWLPDLVACTLAFLAAALIRPALPHPARTFSAPLEVLRFEPRWAFYRAAALLWIGDFTIAVGAGLLLAVLEWSLEQRLWERTPVSPQARSTLLRLAFSSAIFWATGNLWITAAMQAGLILLLQKSSSPARGEPQNGRRTAKG